MLRGFIGLFQVLGGAFGFLVFRNFPSLYVPPGTVTLVLVQLMCAASIAAGLALWVRPKIGVPLSLFVQLPQAFSFAIWRITYVFALGPFYGVELTFNSTVELERSCHFETYFHVFEPTFILRTGPRHAGFGLGVNLVSVIIVALLLWSSRSSKPAKA